MLALTILAVPGLTRPEPAVAGSSCTSWTSYSAPPRTIKVLRTRTGRIEKVAFRRYVARVMASGEWPSRLKSATLEAGAVATKQYAWFYAMRGNHRPYYVRGGRCYDVRDDTRDQLYRPWAKPSTRQQAAESKTWGLSLRKGGRFFLTGYRAGTSSSCAADANGWKLYALSVEACARQGWSYKRILSSYLSPNLKMIWSDKVGPVVSKPRIVLKVGNRVASGAATVAWHPVPRKAADSRFKLQRKVSGGVWKDIALPKSKAWKTDAWVKVDARTRFRVRAANAKGNWGPWSYSARRRADVRGPAGITIAGAGVSTTAAAGTAAAGTRKVRSRFKGRSVALVMRTGPGMGRVRVLVDGKRAATVDLERPGSTPGKLVFARNWSKAGRHVIAVRPLTPGKRVHFQGFFVLR
jgi:hypothetical protein